MSSRSASPGGALLRASRMFSMPEPLPLSHTDASGFRSKHSENSTTPYPTHLAVTTPFSSRMKGDWGFKRSFPLKTTTKQTMPLIRINQVDSYEQITDFHSASAHTMTLMKFQELNMPITVPAEDFNPQYHAVQNPKSVFEDERDFTAIKPGEKFGLESRRWKFDGPWLAGLTDGQLEKYINKTVRGRREEFRQLLKERLAAELTVTKAQAVRQQSPDAPLPSPVVAGDITEQQYTDYVRQLRQNDRTELFSIIGRFLDLAPVSLPVQVANSFNASNRSDLQDNGAYGSGGPPKSHPSGGLSYLRTRNFQENHPVYGPQKHHAPVKGRILKPRSPAAFVQQAVFGVAGIISQDSSVEGTLNASKVGEKEKDLVEFDVTKKGGAKKYFSPVSASMKSDGTISLHTEKPDPMSEVVKKEMVGEADVFEEALKNPQNSIPVTVSQRPRGATFRKINVNQGYGLGQRDI